MSRTRLWLTLSLICLFTAACAPTPDPGSTFKGTRFTRDQLDEGRVFYEQICAACHGTDGQGQFPAAPMQPDTTGRIGAPPHNENGHSWHHTDELLVRYVIEGGFANLENFYQMPSFNGTLTREQAINIIGYIKTMWTAEQRIEQVQLTQEEERMVAETAR